MTTLENLRSGGSSKQLKGIFECYDNRSASEEEIAELRKLQDDQYIIGGRYMSSYASAILDLIGVEKYTGDNVDTLKLIHDLQYKEGQARITGERK